MLKALIATKTRKIFLGIGIAAIALIGFLWWQNGSLQETVGSLQSEKSQLVESLETTRNSVFTLKAQMQLSDEIAEDQKEKRRKLTQEIDSLENALEAEKKNNPKLEECLNVQMPEFSKQLREQTKSSEK